MDVDPLASMRCWAIDVQLGGREFEIPALPAVDWWPVLVDPTEFLDFLKSPELDGMLLDGEITSSDLTEAVTDAIEEVTGRTFHAAFVLATVASVAWATVGGRLARDGFQWDRQPIGAALDAIYSVLIDGLSETSENGKPSPKDQFLAMLDDESIGQPGKKRTASQKVVDEFEAMAGPRPAPAPLPGKASAGPSGSPRPRTRTRPRQLPPDGQSAVPRKQPGRHAQSGPAARSGRRTDEA